MPLFYVDGNECYKITPYEAALDSCNEQMSEHIFRKIVYPTEAVENGIEGTVESSFVIEKDGSVTYIQVDRGLGFGTDEEVLRILNLLLKPEVNWVPGKINSCLVRTRVRLPVSFKLQN